MKKSITQEDSMGCGAACVAYVTGSPYHVAVSILGITKAQTRGFHIKELVEGLKYFGYSSHYSRIKVGERRIYHEGDIVFIRRYKRYPYGHYLVKISQGWMDPWINLPFDQDIMNAQSGLRKRLPGKAQYVVSLDK